MSIAIFYGSAISTSILLYQSLIPFIIVFELDIDELFKIIFAFYIAIFYHQRAGNREDAKVMHFGDLTFGIDAEYIDPRCMMMAAFHMTAQFNTLYLMIRFYFPKRKDFLRVSYKVLAIVIFFTLVGYI